VTDPSLPVLSLDVVLFPGRALCVPAAGHQAALDGAHAAGAQLFVGATPGPGPGHVGTLAQAQLTPDGQCVVLTGLGRARIEAVEQHAPCVRVKVAPLEEPWASEAVFPLAREVVARFRQVTDPSLRLAPWLEQLVVPDDAVHYVAAHAGLAMDQQQALLEVSGIEARAGALLGALEGRPVVGASRLRSGDWRRRVWVLVGAALLSTAALWFLLHLR
jgi:hypothetical protein